MKRGLKNGSARMPPVLRRKIRRQAEQARRKAETERIKAEQAARRQEQRNAMQSVAHAAGTYCSRYALPQ
ncbi:hypothetical protein NIB75_18970 [Bacteroides uniformis]|nr:hypothetical protein [Bacteroides uniformis]